MIPAFGLENLTAYSLQIALLVAAGGVLAALARVRLPRVMLAYWQVLLAAALLLPALQPWRPADTAEVVTGPASMGRVAPNAEGSSLAEVALLILAAGAAVRVGRLAIGLGRLRRHRREARPHSLPITEDLRGALRVDPRFYVSDRISVPATFGTRRPVILLPASFATMDLDRQRAVACHEMVHVRRRDWLVLVVEELVGAVFWFHPAVAWLRGRIRLSREQVVDREVVRLTRAPRPYLEALVEMARSASRPPLAAPLFLKECHLRERVDLLLEEVSMSRPRLFATLALTAVILTVAAGLAVVSFPLHAAVSAHDAAGGVPGGVSGGIEGGIEGGVEGGVPGGVAGGVEGGVAGGVAGEKKAAAPRKLARSVPVVYPAEAKKDGLAGDVVLEVTIEKSGEVSGVRVTSGHETLAPAALAAVRQWRYEPSAQGPVVATVTIRFAPKPRKVSFAPWELLAADEDDC